MKSIIVFVVFLFLILGIKAQQQTRALPLITKSELLRSPSGKIAGGSTIPRGGWFTSLKSSIKIAPGIKGYYSADRKISFAQMAISHEALHAYHLYNALPQYNIYSERAASAYSLYFLKQNGISTFQNIYRSAINNYPSTFSWQNLLRLQIINMGAK